MRAKYIADPAKWVEEFQFFVDVKVRFSETDMYGHLNNTVPFTYFEFARIEYLKHLGFMSDWMKQDGEKIIVVADLQCDFVQEAYFDENLKVYVKVGSLGTSSIDIHYLGKNEKSQVVFTGRGTIVQIHRQTGKSAPWTEEERNILLGQS